MNCSDFDREDRQTEIRREMAWARNICTALLAEFVDHVGDIEDPRAQENVFSSLVGVALATFREAGVRMELADPALVEIVASIEVARAAQRESEQRLKVQELEAAMVARTKDQVPS